MAEESITDVAMRNLRRQGFSGSFVDMERQRLIKKAGLSRAASVNTAGLSIKDLYALNGEKPWNVKR